MSYSQRARRFFDELMSFPSKKITKQVSVEVYPAYRVLRFDGRHPERPKDYEIALVNVQTQEIAYFVDVAHLGTDLGGKPTVHALAFRSTDAAHKIALENFASSIMFDLLVPNHTVILASGNQSAGGIFLWQARLSEAIHFGRKAYFVQSDGNLRPLSSNADFQALRDEVWSLESTSETCLAVLSRKELSEQANYEKLLGELRPRMSVKVNEMILASPSESA